MREVLNSTRFCLKHSSNLKKTSDYKLPISQILTNQLHMFSITHCSIRVVVAAAIKSKFYPLIADALSLAREQVEKVFIVATLLDNPNPAFQRYWRSSWQVEYEKYLLEQEEHRENERFEEFLKDTTPKRLEKMRRDPIRKDVLISQYAKRILTYHWNNPTGGNPSWFRKTKSKKKPRDVPSYIRYYFNFATPGAGMKRIQDLALRRFLFRWHKEYRALSQYTHVTIRIGNRRIQYEICYGAGDASN